MQVENFANALREFWRVYKSVKNATQSALHIKPIEEFCRAELISLGLDKKKLSCRHTVREGCLWSKNCDVVYGLSGPPSLVISCKSISSSFGNNARNRLEEALADAVNLRSENRNLVMGLCFIIADSEVARGKAGRTNYVTFFESILEKLNGRGITKHEDHKYERVAYVPAVFEGPDAIRTDKRVLDATWPLNMSTFFSDLIRDLKSRSQPGTY